MGDRSADVITLVSGEGDEMQLSKELACRSQVIESMLGSSFFEAIEGRISFPEFSTDVLQQVVLFLRSPTLLGRFMPEPETAMEVMMAANYLDLPVLTGCCVSLIAKHLDALSSFGDIPSGYISKVCCLWSRRVGFSHSNGHRS